MAADQDRAERIRRLKADNPGTTWQAIANYCHVTVRAAQAWQETGGIAYENAKKLAELWDVDVDYIMRGERQATPDLSLTGDGDALERIGRQLERVERKLDLLLGTTPAPTEELEDLTLLDLPEDFPLGSRGGRRAQGTSRRGRRPA